MVKGVTGRLCKEDMCVKNNAILVLSYARAMAIAGGVLDTAGIYDQLPGGYVRHAGHTAGAEPHAGGRLRVAARRMEPPAQKIPVPPLPSRRRNSSAAPAQPGVQGKPFPTLCQDRIGRDTQEVLEAGCSPWSAAL